MVSPSARTSPIGSHTRIGIADSWQSSGNIRCGESPGLSGLDYYGCAICERHGCKWWTFVLHKPVRHAIATIAIYLQLTAAPVSTAGYFPINSATSIQLAEKNFNDARDACWRDRRSVPILKSAEDA